MIMTYLNNFSRISFLLLFAVLLLPSNATGQELGRACGTKLSQEQEEWLRHYVNNKELYAFNNRSVQYIPLQIHIVGDDNGNGYYSLSDLFNTICRLNSDFEQTNLYFYLENDINYIDNSDYYDHDYSDGIRMMRRNNVDGNVNVYFVNTPMEGNCGYFAPYGDAVAISKSCQGSDGTTLTHELGHFFNLPHTFSGWEGYTMESNPLWEDAREKVDGSNCRSTGDYFCDTPPDYISNRWSCPYNKNYEDPNGEELDIDGSLFMSYSNDECQSRFSDEQIDAMIANINDERDDLLRDSYPEFINEIGTVTTVRPKEDSYNTAHNFSTFLWKEVPGAMGYLVQVSRFSSFNNTVVDTFITQHYLELYNRLDEGREYKWRVYPIGAGYTCLNDDVEIISFYASEEAEVDSNWMVQYQSINESESLNTEALIFPSVVSNGGELNLFIGEDVNEKYQVSLINISGQIVSQIELQIVNGSAVHELQNISKGLYEVQVSNGNRVFRNKIIVFE